METRPRIKIKPSPLDKWMERGALIMLFLMWGLTAYSFLNTPAVVPIHFNALGEPDSYGSKTVLLLLPFLGTAIYFGFTELNKHPHIFNYIPKITNENAERHYTAATKMIRFMKLSILFIFTLIILFSYLTTIGVIRGLGNWFLPFIMLLLLIPTFISVRNSLKSN